jgi:hypothetical protein
MNRDLGRPLSSLIRSGWESQEQIGSGNYPSLRLQADFFVGRRNSSTFPRSCGGSHFTSFENVDGM